MIRTQVASGRLIRLRRGVFVAASAWPDDQRQRHIMTAWAEQTMYESAVMSHQTAAEVWRLPHPGFDEWFASDPTVTVPADSGLKARAAGVVHRLAALPSHHVTQDEAGYAVTTVARTAIDLAVGLALPQALVVLDASARILVGSMVVQARRQEFANPRLAAAAREAMSEASQVRRSAALPSRIAFADPRRESAAESLSAGYFELAGLPRPLLQHPIRTRIGVLFPDFYWPEQRLIGECDGAIKYGDRAALVGEKVREDVLRELGNGVVRWLGREIMLTPDDVVERVDRGLNR
jgi:hypothetical protein